MTFAVRLATLCFATCLALAATLEGRATRDAPPPGHTGGFGEPTCQHCHFQADVNQGGGSLTLDGVPESYEPGATYDLAAVLTHAGLAAGGFQLAARFEDGSQAGELSAAPAEAGRAAATTHRGVQYIHHLHAGTHPQAADTIRWIVRWTAPPCARSVLVHAAASAADADDSPLGDFVYTTSAALPPATDHHDDCRP